MEAKTILLVALVICGALNLVTGWLLLVYQSRLRGLAVARARAQAQLQLAEDRLRKLAKAIRAGNGAGEALDGQALVVALEQLSASVEEMGTMKKGKTMWELSPVEDNEVAEAWLRFNRCQMAAKRLLGLEEGRQ